MIVNVQDYSAGESNPPPCGKHADRVMPSPVTIRGGIDGIRNPPVVLRSRLPYRSSMVNFPFIAVLVIAAAALIFALVAGVRSWSHTSGKLMAILAGLLLVLLFLFALFVLVIAISGNAGHPF